MGNIEKMKDKGQYRELCKTEKSIPIFSQDWWLDCVCGENNWDVVLVKSKGNIIAALPYYKQLKYGFKYINMPKLTQTLGIWIYYPPDQKYANKLSYEHNILCQLINRLPKFDFFYQNFHYTLTNWLPFYWKGFQQSTLYTYVIQNLYDLNEVQGRFKSNMRNKIRKAQKEVDIVNNRSIEEFHTINELTFKRQGLSSPYSLAFLKKMDKTLEYRNSRKIFFAVDKRGAVHSALYLIWDSMSSYLHMMGENPKLRKSGAGILLIWEALKFTSKELGLDRFDFEGSMIESVEKVRCSCGGIQQPYFNINKINSPFLILTKFLKKFIKRNKSYSKSEFTGSKMKKP